MEASPLETPMLTLKDNIYLNDLISIVVRTQAKHVHVGRHLRIKTRVLNKQQNFRTRSSRPTDTATNYFDRTFRFRP